MIARVQCAAVAAPMLLASALAGCSSASPQPATFGADPFTTMSTDSMVYSLEVRTSPQPPARGTISVQYRIRNLSDGSLADGLTVTVAPWMPAPYDHGPSVAPTVVAQGQGVYLATDVDLFMGGPWTLKTSVSGPAGNDKLVLSFDVP